jgi:hypothetical protein
MLDKLKAADFKKHIGGVATAVVMEGPDAPLTIVEVKELPAYKTPDAKKGTRTPFSVLLRSDAPCALCKGDKPRELVLPDGARLDPVLITEISPHPNPNDPPEENMSPDMRFFQICFG